MQVDHTQAIIEINNVSFAFTNEDAVKEVSLDIKKGSYVGIVGPNGGGKSTLLKLMLGLLRPREGSIKLFGTDISDFRDRSKIGYVPQRKLFDTNVPVTVQEMVAMGRFGKIGLFRLPTKKDKKKTLEALEQVDMLEYKDRLISDLSGGQQQRVLIARALAAEPEVIFLDEPTVGVDMKTQKQFYELLRKLNQDYHLTLILVTHELEVVAQEASELAYINRTLDYFGNPEKFIKGTYFRELIGKGGIHN